MAAAGAAAGASGMGTHASPERVASDLAAKGFTLQQLLRFRNSLLDAGDISKETSTREVVRDVVIPRTSHRRCCYVDTMEGGPQKAWRLVSHWWGLRFNELALSIAQDASSFVGSHLETKAHSCKFKGEALGKTYWLCALAVNQHVSICGTALNPCSCGSQKFLAGHPLCQIDKFDVVAQMMPGGVTVIVDKGLKTLERVWVAAEIGTALHYNMPLKFVGDVPEGCDATNVKIPLVEHCSYIGFPTSRLLHRVDAAKREHEGEATSPVDKELVLRKISSTVGFQEFNRKVSAEILRGLRTLFREATRRAEERVGNLFVRSRSRWGSDVSEDYDLGEGSSLGGAVSVGPAVSRTTGEGVRVKTVRIRDLRDDDVGRLAREAEILLSTDHTHIIRLLDVYESDDAVSLVLERLTGPDPVSHLAGKPSHMELEVATIAYQMLLAVQHLHSRGIVHHGLNLESFTYESPDSDLLKLSDVGCSMHIMGSSTKMAKACGGLVCMSPEVLAESYDHKCDLWSLGVIVFMLMCGECPFAGSEEQMLQSIQEGSYTMRRECWSCISRDGIEFVRALLTRDPARRPDAPQALGHDWIRLREQLHEAPPIDSGVMAALNDFAEASHFQRICMQAISLSLSQKDMQQLRKAFLEIDVDGSGSVSLQELSAALAECGFEDAGGKGTHILGRLDVNADRQINYNEFLAAMAHSQVDLDDGIVRETFRRFDVDNSGMITPKELCHLMGGTLNEDDVRQSFAEVDVDGDGRVDYNELQKFMNGFGRRAGARAAPAVQRDLSRITIHTGSGTVQCDPSDIVPERFGLKLQQRLLILEYVVPKKGLRVHHHIKVGLSPCGQEAGVDGPKTVGEMQHAHGAWLSGVAPAQIQRMLDLFDRAQQLPACVQCPRDHNPPAY